MTDRQDLQAADFDEYLARLDEAMAERLDDDGTSAEVADHLFELRDELIAAGHAPVAAERLALQRMGHVATIAGAHRSARLSAVHQVGLLVAVAGCAVGLAGLVGAVLHVASGSADPSAPSAGLAHDAIRVLVGVVGAAGLEALSLYRDGRRVPRTSRLRRTAFVGSAVVAVIVAATSGGVDPFRPWWEVGACTIVGALAFWGLHRRFVDHPHILS